MKNSVTIDKQNKGKGTSSQWETTPCQCVRDGVKMFLNGLLGIAFKKKKVIIHYQNEGISSFFRGKKLWYTVEADGAVYDGEGSPAIILIIPKEKVTEISTGNATEGGGSPIPAPTINGGTEK